MSWRACQNLRALACRPIATESTPVFSYTLFTIIWLCENYYNVSYAYVFAPVASEVLNSCGFIFLTDFFKPSTFNDPHLSSAVINWLLQNVYTRFINLVHNQAQ